VTAVSVMDESLKGWRRNQTGLRNRKTGNYQR